MQQLVKEWDGTGSAGCVQFSRVAAVQGKFGAASGCTHVARCWDISEQRVGLPAVVPTERCFQNNNNNVYLLQLCYHPVAVVILHIYTI